MEGRTGAVLPRLLYVGIASGEADEEIQTKRLVEVAVLSILVGCCDDDGCEELTRPLAPVLLLVFDAAK